MTAFVLTFRLVPDIMEVMCDSGFRPYLHRGGAAAR